MSREQEGLDAITDKVLAYDPRKAKPKRPRVFLRKRRTEQGDSKRREPDHGSEE